MVLLLLAYLSWWEHCVIQRLGFEFQIYHFINLKIELLATKKLQKKCERWCYILLGKKNSVFLLKEKKVL